MATDDMRVTPPPSAAARASHFRLFGPSLLRRRRSEAEPLVSGRLRILLVVSISWLPLLLLSAAQRRLVEGPRPFLSDVALHARLLVSLPALLIVRQYAGPAASAAMRYLVQSGIVTVPQQTKCAEQLRRSSILAGSWLALVAIVCLAYALTALELVFTLQPQTWKNGAAGGVSLASLWYHAVSRPLYLTQLLTWIWSFAVWAVTLAKMVRLPLRLLAYHPDHFGGLRPILRYFRCSKHTPTRARALTSSWALAAYLSPAGVCCFSPSRHSHPSRSRLVRGCRRSGCSVSYSGSSRSGDQGPRDGITPPPHLVREQARSGPRATCPLELSGLCCREGTI